MVKIRRATSGDFDAIWELEKTTFGEETEESLKRALKSRTFVYFVMIDDDEIIGYAGLNELLGEAEILTIMIEKSHRQQGYGKMMLEKLLSHAKNNGAEKIFLEVDEHNSVANKLYSSFGFKELMRRENYYLYKDGSKADAIIMSKKLV
ncbi:MAG: ribosomal protein S18-alanine N-acetyltransferase [Clostridia bacterium]|nr:ribosomal protein S18-alanine N-acetyltransferase [Clostridia bacterium]